MFQTFVLILFWRYFTLYFKSMGLVKFIKWINGHLFLFDIKLGF